MVCICLKNLRNIDTLWARLAIAAACAIELRELLEILEGVTDLLPLLLCHWYFEGSDFLVLDDHLEGLHTGESTAYTRITENKSEGKLVCIEVTATELLNKLSWSSESAAADRTHNYYAETLLCSVLNHLFVSSVKEVVLKKYGFHSIAVVDDVL